MSSLSFASRLIAVAACSVLLSACSTTPDRYAFWRDGTPTASELNAPPETKKPNLADIPASPDVSQARKDMQDLQTKLAADRNAAYQQAQNDKTNDMVTPLQPVATGTIATDNLPPVGTASASTTTSQTTDSAIQVSQDALGDIAPANGPAMQNPNASVNPNMVANALPTWPVYMPPSVQVNPPVRPYAALQPTQAYAYGRNTGQFRQQMNNGGSLPIPAPNLPSVPVAANNTSVVVDMSALGGAGMRGGAMGGNGPSIYFQHGSTQLSAKDRKTLAVLAASAKKTKQPVTLVGHASTRTAVRSPVQARMINMKISKARAERVKQALTKQGVKPQQISTSAVGDQGAGNTPTEAMARRVDVLIGR